jgi:hypothetical protein
MNAAVWRRVDDFVKRTRNAVLSERGALVAKARNTTQLSISITTQTQPFASAGKIRAIS